MPDSNSEPRASVSKGAQTALQTQGEADKAGEADKEGKAGEAGKVRSTTC
jgi:hypothetical protein